MISNLIDNCIADFNSPANNAQISRIQIVLSLYLKQNDIDISNIKCYMTERTFIEQLLLISGVPEDQNDLKTHFLYEIFSIKYDIDFPCSIVLSRKSLVHYELIFRFLFTCLFIEKRLARIKVQMSRKNDNSQLYFFIQNALHFLNNVRNYGFYDILEKNWNLFNEKIMDSQDIESIISHHDDFLEKCMKGCMLTNVTLLKVIFPLIFIDFE